MRARPCVCGLHIEPLFLPIDIHHTYPQIAHASMLVEVVCTHTGPYLLLAGAAVQLLRINSLRPLLTYWRPVRCIGARRENATERIALSP